MKIRGVDGYSNVLESISLVKNYDSRIQVWLGCLIQNNNYRDLLKIYEVARHTSADGIFFNVPEIRNGSFGRKQKVSTDTQLFVSPESLSVLKNIFSAILIQDEQFDFLCQSHATFEKFLYYFENVYTPSSFPPRKCDVSNYSVTLNESGKIKPCFYLPESFSWNGVTDPLKLPSYINFGKCRSEHPICSDCNICAQFTPQ